MSQVHAADAFGSALMDFHRGEARVYHIERDDNYLEAGDLSQYFHVAEFSEQEKVALNAARGRVLDIGCGAGKHAVWLQEKGLDVTGMDVSPRALMVCQERGMAKGMQLDISCLNQLPSNSVDTVLMMGNNFGLLGSFGAGRERLKQLHRIASRDGVIYAMTSDPYKTTQRVHLDYHKLNLARGRMAGQLRFRIRYKNLVNDWMDYLLASEDEVAALLSGTGWELRKTIIPNPQERFFLAVIVKAND